MGAGHQAAGGGAEQQGEAAAGVAADHDQIGADVVGLVEDGFFDRPQFHMDAAFRNPVVAGVFQRRVAGLLDQAALQVGDVHRHVGAVGQRQRFDHVDQV